MANYTFYVTVSGGKFVIDGVSQQTVDLGHNLTYRFDQSDSSNGAGGTHPLRFSTTSDGTHGGGSEYTTGVTTNGTPGQSGAYTEIAVTSSTTNPLYYYCSNHSGMGGQANTTSAEFANTTGVALKKPILANATDKWGQFSNQNLDTIAGKLPQSFVFPTGTGDNQQVILSNGSGGTSWGDVALTPEISGLTWYSDSGYSSTLSASEAININPSSTTTTGTLTSGSGNITNITTSNIRIGDVVTGTGIASGTTTVSSITTPGSSNDGTIVVSGNSTSSGSQSLTFSSSGGSTTYLKVTGQNFGSSGVFGGNAYVQIINTTQSNAVVGNNQSGLTGCVTSASYQSEAEVRFTINPSGVSGISSGDTLKVKFVTGGGESLFATGYVVSADPTSVTTVNSATISNTDSVGSFGGTVAGGGQDSNTKLLLNFDRTGGTDIEDSSNTGGDGHKITANGTAVIKASPFGDGKSAIKFDGSGDYLSTTLASGGIGSGDFTLDFWFQRTGSGGSGSLQNVIDQRSSGFANGILLQFNESTQKLRLYSPVGTAFDIAGSKALTLNQWHHIAIVRDSGTFIRVYVDGVLDINETTSGKTNHDYSNTGFRVGASSDNSARTEDMEGYIDELRLVLGEAIFTSDFSPSKYRYGTTGATHEASTASNMKLLIHSDRHGGLSPETGDRRNYISVTDVGPLKRTTSTGTASQLVDGDTSATGSGTYWFESGHTSGHLLFDFKDSAIVNKFTWIQNNSSSQGQWTFSGSHDNSSFTALKTNFDLVSGTSTDHTFTNTTAYRYYKLEKTGTGSTSAGPYTHEIQFFNTADLSNAFTDSATSGTTHTITPTGSIHSAGHGGIAPALTWPASLKKTGSAGVLFTQGSADYITTELNPVIGTGAFTIDFWCYPLRASGNEVLVDTRNTSNLHGFMVQVQSDRRLRLYVSGSSAGDIDATTPDNEDGKITLNAWNHIAVGRVNGGKLRIHIDGKGYTASSSNSTSFSEATLNIGNEFGRGTTYTACAYIDSFRYSNSTRYDTDDFSSSLPTQIYGAFKSDTIDTITLTGSVGSGQSGYVTFNNATLSGQTETTSALPAGLSLNEAESQDNTATITGDLTASAGSHAINLVARVTSDGTDAEIDPNRKQAYSHTITKASGGAPVLFNARRYVGTSANKEISGLALAPDLVWIKERTQSSGWHHQLFDSVRGSDGTNYYDIESNRNVAQGSSANSLKELTNDGFKLGVDPGEYVNKVDKKYIGWCFKAGGAPTATNSGGQSPTSGSVMINGSASTANLESATLYPKKMSVNTSAGFSIVQYEGTASNKTIPHGLSQRPDFIIIKKTEATGDWIVWHKGLTNALTGNGSSGTDYRIYLNYTDAEDGPSNTFNYTPPTNSVVSVSDNGHVNSSGDDFIMYCFHSVSGKSAFGSYTGPQSGPLTSGSPTYCGFKPRMVIIRCISHTEYWLMFDQFRETTNTFGNYLFANEDDSESSGTGITVTVTDDGFTTGSASGVGLGTQEYIFMAFA